MAEPGVRLVLGTLFSAGAQISPSSRYWVAILRCPAHGRLDGLGQLYGDEAFRGEKVVLATFVNDSNVARRLGVWIGQRDVDLVPLQ
jgi:hypothetical protein